MSKHRVEVEVSWEDVDNLRTAQIEAQRAAEVQCNDPAERTACPECQEAVDRFKARLHNLSARLGNALIFAAALPPREEG